MLTATTRIARPIPRALAFLALTACSTTMTPSIVEISGHSVEVVETGDGETTVVFESGLGNDWSPWDAVIVEVAPHAPVFAYSRPGYGRSDPSSDPRDAATIVADLRALLAARGHSPPYVLVGHSFGGTYMELFAKAHPDEVAGLVLVETRHRDFTEACDRAGLIGCTIPDDVVASLPAVEMAEYEGFARSSAQIAAAGAFGSYPVRVLTTDSHGFPPEVEALWVAMHGELAAEAPDGAQVVFPGAGHYLPSDRPSDVAAIILEILTAAGTR